MIASDHNYTKRSKAKPVYVVSVSSSKQYKQDAEKWWDVGLTNVQLWQRVTIDGNRLVYHSYDAAGNMVDLFMLRRLKSGSKRFSVLPADKTK
jgi:hypothetical protein